MRPAALVRPRAAGEPRAARRRSSRRGAKSRPRRPATARSTRVPIGSPSPESARMAAHPGSGLWSESRSDSRGVRLAAARSLTGSTRLRAVLKKPACGRPRGWNVTRRRSLSQCRRRHRCCRHRCCRHRCCRHRCCRSDRCRRHRCCHHHRCCRQPSCRSAAGARAPARRTAAGSAHWADRSGARTAGGWRRRRRGEAVGAG